MTVKENLKSILDLIDISAIKSASNIEIVTLYYYNIHELNLHDLSFMQYVTMVKNRKIPTYETISRALRKLREENHKWKKPSLKVKDQINHVKKEAYGRT